MRHKITAGVWLMALVVAPRLGAQRVPVASDAYAPEGGWPSVEAIGVPIYPDLEAFMAGVSPASPFGSNGEELWFINFASQTDVATLLAWYGEHAEGWVVDEDLGMLFPEGGDVDAAMMGQSPFVNISDMGDSANMGMCMLVPCKSMVQVVYQPGG